MRLNTRDRLGYHGNTAPSDTVWQSKRLAERACDIDDRIRHRAYHLYEQRGTVDGFALDDWLQAEAEVLRAQKQPKVKSAKAAK